MGIQIRLCLAGEASVPQAAGLGANVLKNELQVLHRLGVRFAQIVGVRRWIVLRRLERLKQAQCVFVHRVADDALGEAIDDDLERDSDREVASGRLRGEVDPQIVRHELGSDVVAGVPIVAESEGCSVRSPGRPSDPVTDESGEGA